MKHKNDRPNTTDQPGDPSASTASVGYKDFAVHYTFSGPDLNSERGYPSDVEIVSAVSVENAFNLFKAGRYGKAFVLIVKAL
jgi:hypothetical protein